MESTGTGRPGGQGISLPMPASSPSTASAIRHGSATSGSAAIGRHNAVLYFQPNLVPGKQKLFLEMARGFDHVTGSVAEIAALPDAMIPVVGCQMELRDLHEEWRSRGRRFVYWDRGYLNRGGKTWLPRASGPEYFRFHVDRYQMDGLVDDAQDVRFRRLRLPVAPWRRARERIVVAAPSDHYAEFHRLGDWLDRTVEALRRHRVPIVIRRKQSTVPLRREIANAACLVTHGSVAAIEAVMMGCPVVVDPSCAAAAVGTIVFEGLESLVYPDRSAWLASIASSQFTADEVANGQIWSMLR